jgi:hypothetical protein
MSSQVSLSICTRNELNYPEPHFIHQRNEHVRPWVQSPVLQKKKREREKRTDVFGDSLSEGCKVFSPPILFSSYDNAIMEQVFR